MDFAVSDRVRELQAQLTDFLDNEVRPAEPLYEVQFADADPAISEHPPVIEELKQRARDRGLWNLFMPDSRWGAELTNVDYAPLAEVTGRSPIYPEVLNCAAPDTGNMEILAGFGSVGQQDRWLKPLLAGEIRSCFAMTEPDVASSDATNIQTTIRRDGDEYVIDGRKWWITGAASPRCKLAIVLGRSGGDRPHHQHSMVIVPMDAPGLKIVRTLPTLGFEERPKHAELTFDGVRVPVANGLGEEGSGFQIAQARLGPGRIHHCMRLVGMAEYALELARTRAVARTAFGKPIAEQGVFRDQLAESRIAIDQARLLVHQAAWLIDAVGVRAARTEISAIKVAVPRMACRVLDWAIQVHGGAGMSNDTPLASMYAIARTLRIADGPDDVHKMVIARRELRDVQAAVALAPEAA